MDRVEMHPAYMWDCPECGIENFERGISLPLSDEEIDELITELGFDPENPPGSLHGCPMSVVCSDCGHEFESIPFGQSEPGIDE